MFAESASVSLSHSPWPMPPVAVTPAGSDAITLGVDVSVFQPPAKVDYGKLRTIGNQQFLIARASYGIKPDATFAEHVSRAREAGFKVGGYLFLRQSQTAADQLAAFRDQLELAGIGAGDIAPAIDMEDNSQFDGPVRADDFNFRAQTVIAAIKAEFGEAIAYLAPGFYQTLGSPKWLTGYPWWIAHYTSKPEPWCPWKEWDIWQFTGSKSLPGYSGNIDQNRAKRIPLATRYPAWQSELKEYDAEIGYVVPGGNA